MFWAEVSAWQYVELTILGGYAAEDNLQFLLVWLEKYPEYKKNDFYLLGESYAGKLVLELITFVESAVTKTGCEETTFSQI